MRVYVYVSLSCYGYQLFHCCCCGQPYMFMLASAAMVTSCFIAVATGNLCRRLLRGACPRAQATGGMPLMECTGSSTGVC